MAGAQVPGSLGRDPFSTAVAEGSTTLDNAGLTSPGPVGIEPEPPDQLASQKKVVKVTKDWSDPPSVTPDFTPEVSGKTLAEVLVELKKLTEWGTGGGKISDIQAKSTDAAPNDFTVDLKAEFTLTLPKWKEFDSATDDQKKAWKDMIKNLELHEREHVAIAYRGFNKLVKDLKGKLVTQAAQMVADAGTSIQSDQDDFDSKAKTDHGFNDFTSTGAGGKTFPKVNLDTSKDPPKK